MAEIDSLEIKITTEANKAVTAIRHLTRSLGTLATSLKFDTTSLERLGKINGNNFKKLGEGLQSFANAAKSLQNVDSNNFKKLADGLTKIASIDSSKLEALGKIDGNALKNIGEGVKVLSVGLKDLKGVTAKRFENLAVGIERLAAIQPGNMETVGNALRPLADGINILSNAKFDNKNLQSLIDSLTRLSNANTGSLANIDFTSLGNSIKSLAETLSGAEKVQQNTISMTNAIAKLANSGDNAGKTAAALPQLASKLKEFMQTMSNAPKVESDTIAFTQAIGMLASSGKRAVTTTESLGKLGEELKKFFAVMSNVPTINQNTIQMIQALAQLSNAGGRVGSVFGNLGGRVSNLSRSMGGLRGVTQNVIVGFKNLTRQLMSSMGIYLGIYGAIRGIKSVLDTSSALTEVQNVVDVTFGDMKYKVEDFAETSIEQFGMSALSLKQFASRFQAMGTAMGIDPKLIGNANALLEEQTNGYIKASNSMADMSLNLTKLTADLASFYDVEQADVAEDLAAIFTGQTRPMRDYGIDLTQATLAEWAMRQGLDADIQSMTQAEKTMLRYQYVIANTAAAHNDFSRTADTWANQVRILKQNFQQLGSVVGGTLINAFKPFVSALNNVMGKVISFAKTVGNALGKIFGWTIEVSPTGLTSDIGAIDSGLSDAEDSAGGVSDGLGGAAKNAKDLKKRLSLLPFDQLNQLASNLDDADSGGGGGGKGSGGGAGGWAGDGAASANLAKTETIFDKYKSDIDSLYELGEYIGKTLANALNRIDWDSVYEKARNFGKGLADFLNGLISPELFSALGKTIAGSLNTALHALDSFGERFSWKNFGNSIAAGVNTFFETFDFGLLANTLNVWAKGLLDTLITFLSKTDWKMIGKKIGTFLAEIDFIAIGLKVGRAIWEAINAGIETLMGMFSKAPIETALISLIAILLPIVLSSVFSLRIL